MVAAASGRSGNARQQKATDERSRGPADFRSVRCGVLEVAM